MKKKFKFLTAAIALCAVSALAITAGGCSEDNKVGKWFDQALCAHEWDDGEVTKEATCASKGEITYTCESCEKTKTEKTDKLPHTEVEIELEATCAAEGLTEGVKCAVCDEVLVQPKVVAKLSHFEIPDAAVAATCTTTGLTEGSHCARCGEVITAQTTIAALGHTEVTDVAVAATCTTTGLTEGSHCSVCNEVITAQTIIPAGHTVVTVEGYAATCTTDGVSMGEKCSVCDTVTLESETIVALGHDFDEDFVCTRCEDAPYLFVTNENYVEEDVAIDEFVAGNWYRIYRPASMSSEWGEELNKFIIQIYGETSKGMFLNAEFVAYSPEEASRLDCCILSLETLQSFTWDYSVVTNDYIDIYLPLGASIYCEYVFEGRTYTVDFTVVEESHITWIGKQTNVKRLVEKTAE